MAAEPFDPYTEAGRRILGTIADSPGSTGVPGAQPTRAVLAIHLLALLRARDKDPGCPAGHPAACIETGKEGTTYCRWCEEVGRLRADLAAPVAVCPVCIAEQTTCDEDRCCGCGADLIVCADRGSADVLLGVLDESDDEAADAEGLVTQFVRLKEIIAERDALLALYSGGRAGVVPEGWDAESSSDSLIRTAGAYTVAVHGDGSWRGYLTRNPYAPTTGGPGPLLAMCAEALAWLKAQEVEP